MIQRLKTLLFRNKSVKQTFTKNVFWLTISQIGSRTIRSIIIIYSARLLGVAEYGIFAYVLGLASFFSIFADVGLGLILTREVAKNPEKKSAYFATIFWLKIFLLVVTAALIILVAPHFSKIEKAKSLIFLVALLTIFDGLRDFVIAFFRGNEQMELESFINLITNISITGFGLIILFYRPTAESLFFVYIISSGLGALLAFLLIKKYVIKIFKDFQMMLIKPIVNSMLPIAAMGLLGVFMTNVDLVMLGWLKTSKEIGFYSAGQKIIQMLYTIPIIFTAASFPIITRFIKQHRFEVIQKLMEKTIIASLTIAIPLVAGGFILAKPIISFIYGKDYLPGANAFQIILLPLLITWPGQLIGNFIFAHDQQKKIIGYVALTSINNVVFNYLLIPPFGIVGAAIATFISQTIYNLLTWRVAKKIMNFYTLRYLKKIVTATILIVILSSTLNYLGLNVILNILISIIFYLFLLYLLKEKTVFEAKEIIHRLRT